MGTSKKSRFLEMAGTLNGQTLQEAAKALETTIGTVRAYIQELGGDAIRMENGRIKVDPSGMDELTPIDRRAVSVSTRLLGHKQAKEQRSSEDIPDDDQETIANLLDQGSLRGERLG